MTRLVGVFFSIVLLLTPVTGFAHPGNTASDGCHYCRTNCAKWGEIEGARHCHNDSYDSETTSSSQDDDNDYFWPMVFVGGWFSLIGLGWVREKYISYKHNKK